MKTILRNFLSVLRRFKMATMLNILGLSVAFAAFMVIMMQLDYDRNFDRQNKYSDTIYRIEATDNNNMQAIISRPMGDAFIRSSPHIVAGALFIPWVEETLIAVEENGNRNSFMEKRMPVYPSYTEVFDFDMAEGLATALEAPDNVLIPQSLALKLFGNTSAIGKVLKDKDLSFTVGGVYKDFPKNSSIGNHIYSPFPKDKSLNDWGSNSYTFYIRVDAAENSTDLVDNFKKHFDISSLGENAQWVKMDEIDIALTALPEMHYKMNVVYDIVPKSSRQTLMVLFAIAIAIIVIAGINFTNFSTALTPMRVKSINTQKVLGGTERVIRLALIAEAVAISLFSFLIALWMVHMLQFTPLVSLVDASIALDAHLPLLGGTAALALVTGLLAGLYPSFYMTSFPPALVLKGSFGLSPKGRQLRNVLISLQFVASFALIIGASFMYLQNYFMQHTPLGFDKDTLIVTSMNEETYKSHEALVNRLKAFAGIEDVTFSEQLISGSDQFQSFGRMIGDKHIDYQLIPVDASFLNVLGVEITDGRNFRRDDAKTTRGAYVFNECARRKYDLKQGDRIQDAEIIGFMPDLKFSSFRLEVAPMAVYLLGTENWKFDPRHAYVKVKGGADLHAAMDHVKATLHTFDSDYPFDVRVFDQVLNTLYEKEESLSSLITLFSLVAVFISIVGVFGLVVFDSEYKKKEIGVRKVMGSTTEQILVMFNKSYLYILCACFVVAAPMAWYAVHSWLENFAYRTPMYVWVYPVAFGIVAAITIATVTFQNWRAASANPVDSLKSE